MFAHNCVNYDETRIVLFNSGQVALERIDKGRGDTKLGLGQTLGSLVPFVSADGVDVSCHFESKPGQKWGDGVCETASL